MTCPEKYVWLRWRQFQIPVTVAGFEVYVHKFFTAQFEKHGIPPIPIVLLESDKNSYGWFSFIPQKQAVALCFNVKWNGLTLVQWEDIWKHELAHYLMFLRYPKVREENAGHGKLFYEICREIGAKEERYSNHRSIYVKEHAFPPLTDMKRAFLGDDIATAKAIALEESLYGSVEDNLPFQAWLEWYTEGNSSNFQSAMDDLEQYTSDEKCLTVWSYLKLETAQDESERWSALLNLQEAARRGNVLAAYFWGKALVQGRRDMDMVPCPQKGLYYLEKAARSHFPPAMQLFVKTLRETDNHPAMARLAELIQMDVGDCPEDMIPGSGNTTCFLPFL